MFKGLFKRQSMPIGIDFGAYSIRMMQLEPKCDGYSVIAAAHEVLPARIPDSGDKRHELVVQLLKKMLTDGGFKSRRTVSCLPAVSMQYKNLRVPKMPPDELRSAVEWEAADRLGLNTDRMRLQFFDAGEVRQGEELRREIILMAASAPDVDDHTAILTDAGLQPVCLEAVPCALARATGDKVGREGDDRLSVVLDVGYAASKVLVLRNGRIAFFKLIDIGGRSLDEGVAQRLGLPLHEAAALRRRLGATEDQENTQSSDDQPLFGDTRKDAVQRAVHESLRTTVNDLGKELGLCLRYYSVTFRGRRPDHLHVVGGEASDPQLLTLLAENIGIEVQPMLMAEQVSFDNVAHSVGKHRSQWVVAAGLAMWQPPCPKGRRPAA